MCSTACAWAPSARFADLGMTPPVLNRGLCLLPDPFDFIQRCWVFQSGCVAEFFTQIRSAHDAAHHFCVPGFWYVCHKNHVARSECLTEIACHILFQFGRKSDIAVRSLFKTQKQISASPLMESGTPTAAASLTCGCATRIDSTSAGPTRLPPTLIVSSERPRMYHSPSLSTAAQSPWTQTSGKRDQ